MEEATQEEGLRLVIGQLEEFARRVSEGLKEPDWATRREIVRALVRQVEIDEQEVRVVYRVSPSPFERSPQQGSLQRCWGRDDPTLWRTAEGGSIFPLFEVSDPEHRLDEAEEAAIEDLLGEDRQQDLMVDVVERDDNRMPTSTIRPIRIRMRSR